MTSTKPNKEEVVICGTSVPIYFELMEKVHTTMLERMAGRNVRISLNQIARMTNGEIGRFNPKGSAIRSSDAQPMEVDPPASEGTESSSVSSKNVDTPPVPAKKPRTLISALEPLTLNEGKFEKEVTEDKPPVVKEENTPTAPYYILSIPTAEPKPTGIADIVNRYRANNAPVVSALAALRKKGARKLPPMLKTKDEELKEQAIALQEFTVTVDKYGKPVHLLQDPPLPGPRPAESVPFVPPKQWNDAYFESRLPTAEDVYNAGRQYMTDSSKLSDQPEMFTNAVALARMEAKVKLKDEQRRKIREEQWKKIVADVRGPNDPPSDMKCRRCHGAWMKVVVLNRTKDSPDGQRRPVRCLMCWNYCCYLILQKNVTWEVGRLFGQPKREELQYGRSRIDPKMNGNPTPRMKAYLQDLAIYRWVLRQQGNYEEYPYTLVSNQKEPVRML